MQTRVTYQIFDTHDIQSYLQVMRLRDALRDRKLSTTGKKSELIARLDEWMKAEITNRKHCRVVLKRLNLESFKGMKAIPLSSLTDLLGYQREDRGDKIKEVNDAPQRIMVTNKVKQPNDGIQKQSQKKRRIEDEKTQRPTTRSMTMACDNEQTVKKRRIEDKKIDIEKKGRPTTCSMTSDCNEQKQIVKTQRIKEQNRSMVRRKYTKKTVARFISLRPALIKYEMVWAHVKGYANWPGIIEEQTPKGKYRIHFFGDYSTSDVTKNKIMHLLEGFNLYETLEKPNRLLEKALREAQMFVHDSNRTECPICRMIVIKAQMRQ